MYKVIGKKHDGDMEVYWCSKLEVAKEYVHLLIREGIYVYVRVKHIDYLSVA